MDRRAGTLAGPSNHGYLRERVRYDGEDRLLDEDGRGVMMAWEGTGQGKPPPEVSTVPCDAAMKTLPPEAQCRQTARACKPANSSGNQAAGQPACYSATQHGLTPSPMVTVPNHCRSAPN